MNLAKNLAQWRDQPPEQWIAQVNRFLPPIAVGVLVLLIAFKAADLTWRLLDTPSVPDEVPPIGIALGADSPAAGPGSYEPLREWEPFGRAPDETAAPIPAELLLDAPDTALNLTLLSTWQAQELPERGSFVVPGRGIAVISSGRGAHIKYRAGDAIENVANATLHSVFTDRVVLDRGGGRLETLRFNEIATTAQAGSRVAASSVIRPAQSLSAAASIADAATEAAALIGEHIQFQMRTENGQPIGFAVQPRGDSPVFAELGLEPGDVLTEVNGIPLNDLRNTAQVLSALSETQQASVRIRRNGTDTALILDVGQIQRLSEQLQ